MIDLLEQMYQAGLPIVITRQQYQALCLEVMNIEEWDNLITYYVYKDTPVVISEGE